MRSDDYLALSSIMVAAFATFISILLSADWLSGSLFFGWMLAPIAFGLAVAGWHHKRAHRTFLVDAAVLAMAASLGVLAGMLATIVTAYLIASFSSVPYLLAAGTVAFVAGTVGAFVLATVATFRRELPHHVVQGSLLVGVLIACVTVAATYGLLSHTADSMFENRYANLGDEPSLVSQRILEEHEDLNETLLYDALERVHEDALEDLTEPYELGECHGRFISLTSCLERGFSEQWVQIEQTVRTSAPRIAFEVSDENLTNTDAEPLTADERSRLNVPTYVEPVDLRSMTIEDARAHYARLSLTGHGMFEPDTSQAPPAGRAIHELMYATDAGQVLVRYSLLSADYVAHFQRYRELVGLDILLEAEPALADDPRFASIARELLGEYDARVSTE